MACVFPSSQVIVIGGGLSGVAAANTVVENGGRVLLLEDIGEAPYRIDRLLTHWRLSGSLQQLAGLGFGRFEGCEAADDETRPGFSLEEVLRERSLDLGIPVVGELPFGHGQPNAALPLGRTVRLDGSSGTLSVL